METKIIKQNLNTISYRLHDFLLQNAIGEENAITTKELAKIFGTDTRAIRLARSKINSRTSDIQRLTLVCDKGYYVAKKGETMEETKAQYRRTADYLTKKALANLVEANTILKQAGLEGQFKAKVGNDDKGFVEIGI